MSVTLAGLIGLIVLIILLLFRMPIAFCMGLVGFLGYGFVAGFDASLSNLGLIPYSSVANHSMAVLPLFILMGCVASQARISGDIYKTTYSWLGQIRGGLAMATVVGCGGFAAVSGSTIATSAAMGMVALPEMRKYNYDPGLATGSIAAGGTLGILIPPSMAFILYAMLTEESVGKLFMAGIFPGVLEIAFYMAVIYVLCLHKPQMGPAGPRTTFKQKIKSLRGSWSMLTLFVLVMGGIYLGVFTPTEAGAIGAFGAFVIGFAMRRLSRQNIVESFLQTGQVTAMIMLLFVGATIFSSFLTVTRIPFTLADFIAGLAVNRYIVLSIVLIFYIIIGCFLDIPAIIILTVPIIFPVIMALGFNPIWYGVLMVRVSEIGAITPPVGISCYVISGVTKVPLATVFRGVIPFLIADILQIILLAAFPIISIWLPTVMKGA